MSSNIKVQRICQHCGKEFTAKTTVTQFCGDLCAKRAYKARLKNAKIEASNEETRSKKNQPLEELKAREFLSVTQVSKLIGCSRQNVYNLINSGKLTATNILEKKTIVKRSDLDKLFDKARIPVSQPHTEQEPKQSVFDISDCYTLSEVQTKYGISEKALHELIKRNSVPKMKKGWFAYVPKIIIDNLLNPLSQKYN